MPLVVRRVKVTDLSVLEAFEIETTKRFPARKRWVETFRALLETTLSHEPEGLLVADYDGRAIGVAVARVEGPHPLTGLPLGRILALSVAPGWRTQGVEERLLKEAEASLKSRGCQVIAFSLQSDSVIEAEIFKQAGFKVSAWELEKS
jgi:ribosomal protein S18 acetylase RimI-like enzyme